MKNRIEDLEAKIAGLKRLRKNKVVKMSCEIKRSIEEEIECVEKQLKAAKNELTFSDLVGKYFHYVDNSEWDDYVFVRKVNGENVFCDKISMCNSYYHEIHIYNNQEYSYMKVENFEEISKEEFLQKYHDLCNNMLEMGFGNLLNEN